MLVLSRKQNEAVVITSPGHGGRVITITVVEIRGGRVRLGFEAADDVLIHRSEVSKQRHVIGERKDEPQTCGVAANKTMARWEDDGGGAVSPPESSNVNRENGSRRQRPASIFPPRT